MKSANEGRRIVLAVTERSPLPALWRAAKEHLEHPHDQIIMFMVSDDRWRRAASLPFTREVSRISGHHRNFTQWRAAQIDDEVAANLVRRLRSLAKGAKQKIAIKVVSERKVGDVLGQISVTADVLIVSSEFKRRPLYAELTRLSCQLYLVDAEE